MNQIENIVFTIARMNPPTPGHKELIKTMFQKAAELGSARINLILSSTVDNKKNPIECEDKRMIIYGNVIDKIKTEMNQATVDNIMAEIVCMNDTIDEKYGKHPILSKINYFLDKYGYPQKPVKMYLVIGEDRMDSYGFILDFLLKMSPPVSLEVIGLSRPEGAMSATYIRNLATSGTEKDKDEFFQHMRELGIQSASDIELLYDKIRDNIRTDKRSVEKTRKRYKSKSPEMSSRRKSRRSVIQSPDTYLTRDTPL